MSKFVLDSWQLLFAILAGAVNRKQQHAIEYLHTENQVLNLYSHIQLFIWWIKEDCSNRSILFGQGALRNAVRKYLDHYHAERNHQSLANQLLEPEPDVGVQIGQLHERERLGGILRFYYREAA